MKSGVGLPQRGLRGRRRVLPGIVAFAVVGGVATTIGSPDVVAAGAPASDFNGDGRADLVLGVAGEDLGGHIDAGVVTVVYGDGSGVNLQLSQTVSQDGDYAGTPEDGDHFGRAFDSGDLDGDGYHDLVVGVPNESVGSVRSAGGINVVYGGPGGLAAAGSQTFDQSGAVADDPETGDRFGDAIATGDFDGDGYADVAVGVPAEDVGTVVDAGAVNILYGSAAGLGTGGNAIFSQGGGVPGTPGRDDRFGASLTAGDFNGDGRDDLAIGIPGEDVAGQNEAGAVAVLYGSGSGLTTAGSKQFSQEGAINGTPQSGDRFGHAVASGDFNGDGRDDLAVGAPGEDVKGRDDAGGVHAIYGTASGLRAEGDKNWSQKGKVNNKPEAGDRFGQALAVGDFDGNGRDDLAIGVPGEDVRGSTDAGFVNVLYGRSVGLKAKGDYSLSQKGKIEGALENHDLFGSTVQAVDLDGDGFDDLVAGVPGEDLGSATDAGSSNVVYGSSNGLRALANEAVAQAGAVAGSPETGDGLGLPDYESWLDRVNLYRTQAGLDPVSERASLSDDAERHSRYMVLNGTVTHDQIPGNPGYSSRGDASGGRSNVYGTTLASTSDLSAVDGWVTGPFHAVGFLTPHLVEVGYGAHRDADAGYIRMGATLDIWGAPRDWSKEADGPYAWPGDGSVVPVRSHINEWPSPTTHCPGHRGLPVLAFFEEDVDVQSVSFTLDGDHVPHCVFDGTDYRNPDTGARNLGRSILASADAVVVMPDDPLLPGEEYCFSVRSSGVTVDSCFVVDPNA